MSATSPAAGNISLPIKPKTDKQLSSILCVDRSVTAKGFSQLVESGVENVTEAYLLGYTRRDIANELGCTQTAVIKWEESLGVEDKKLLNSSKAGYDGHLLQSLKEESLRIIQVYADLEIDEEEIKRLMLQDKRMQWIDKLMRTCELSLARHGKLKDAAQDDQTITIINNTVVMNRDDIPPNPLLEG